MLPNSPERQGSGLAFQDFLKQAKYLSNTVSKNKLEALRTIVTKAHERRFRRRKEPRYGSINKDFTEPELQRFLRSIRNDKFHLLFSYQAFLGLRVGEVTKLHIGNIDFDKRELMIDSEKSGLVDSLIIPLDLFKETIDYLNNHSEEIKAAKGYVFFKENDNDHTGLPYLQVDYVRNVFRKTIEVSGLSQSYAISEETDASRRPRTLHRLTTHSLRHMPLLALPNLPTVTWF
ncbi:MAG: site-specific integrase [Candidatus Marsarchaeota archaeon]|nr:site-specific integrase [Candidatus Marsarchaeota archaeon]